MSIRQFTQQLRLGILVRPTYMSTYRYNAMCLWVKTRIEEGYSIEEVERLR